jgi:hypothetical protein
VINRKKDIDKTLAKQEADAVIPEPNKIGSSTPYDFEGKNLTAYGGLLPVGTMLEQLRFQELVEETLTVKRVTRAMSMYQFILAMVLAAYVGFSRLHHLRFVAREPMFTGILKVLKLPPQCTFWRFLASLHPGIARQLLTVQRGMHERVWQAAHVGLTAVSIRSRDPCVLINRRITDVHPCSLGDIVMALAMAWTGISEASDDPE